MSGEAGGASLGDARLVTVVGLLPLGGDSLCEPLTGITELLIDM